MTGLVIEGVTPLPVLGVFAAGVVWVAAWPVLLLVGVVAGCSTVGMPMTGFVIEGVTPLPALGVLAAGVFWVAAWPVLLLVGAVAGCSAAALPAAVLAVEVVPSPPPPPQATRLIPSKNGISQVEKRFVAGASVRACMVVTLWVNGNLSRTAGQFLTGPKGYQ